MNKLLKIPLFIALPAMALANSGIEKVGQLYNYWNHTTSVAVSGEFALVTTDYSSLQVVDISNPLHPEIVARCTLDDSSYCCQIALRDSIAFVALNDLGLKIFDISDPYHPILLAYIDTVSCINLSLDGSFLYTFGDGTYRILDVSNPAQPELIWHLRDDFGMSWLYSPVFRDSLMFYLVMSDGMEGGIGALDFSDPRNPEWYWGIWLPLAWGPSSLTFNNDRAYVAAGDSGVFVVDISNPEAMRHIATVTFDTTLFDLFVLDTLAYANFGDSLIVFDIESDSVWTRTGSIQLDFPMQNLTHSGNLAFGITSPAGFQVLDIADRTDPQIITRFDNYGHIGDAEVVGNTAFIVGNRLGFRTVDITDPANPIEIGKLDYAGYMKYLMIIDTLAFVSEVSMGVRVIDISDPTDPIEIAVIETPPYVERLFLDDTLLYVALDRDGLSVYDISDLQNPVLLGNFDHQGRTVRDVVVQDGYAYLACDQYDLYVLEVTHPEDMMEVSYLATHDYTERLRLDNEILYIADGRGLTILSITDPERPVETGFCSLPGFTRDVVVQGTHALVADYHGGLKVIDITNLENPTLAGSYQTPGNAIGVASIDESHVLVADMTNLGIYDVSEALAAPSMSDVSLQPSTFSLSTFPNPFNSSVRISYSSSSLSSSLRIYDISGRQVATFPTLLAGGESKGGSGSVTWDASSVGAGVYFVRLEAGEGIQTKKLILMR